MWRKPSATLWRKLRYYTKEHKLRPFTEIPQAEMDYPKENIHLVNQVRHKKLGPLYREYLGPDVSILWVGDAQLGKEVFQQDSQYPRHLVPEAWKLHARLSDNKRGLFFLDGPEWARWRTTMNRVFIKEFPSGCLEYVSSASDDLLRGWSILLEQSMGSLIEVPNLEHSLIEWSVKATLAALFGSRADKAGLDMEELIRNVNGIFEASSELQSLSAQLEAENETELWTRFSNSMDGALTIMDAMARLDSDLCDRSCLVGKMRLQTDFTKEEIGRMAVDLIVAAADTTSITAAWILHKLSTDEREQENINKDPRKIRQHQKECLRLYPVAPFLTRIPERPIQLAGFEVPAGHLILLSNYAMGRMPEYFKEPEKYWPERWEREKGSGQHLGVRNSYASLPFGHGIRNCIGKKIAEEAIKDLVSNAVLRYRLSDLNKLHELGMTMKFTGKPDSEIKLGIKRR